MAAIRRVELFMPKESWAENWMQQRNCKNGRRCHHHQIITTGTQSYHIQIHLDNFSIIIIWAGSKKLLMIKRSIYKMYILVGGSTLLTMGRVVPLDIFCSFEECIRTQWSGIIISDWCYNMIVVLSCINKHFHPTCEFTEILTKMKKVVQLSCIFPTASCGVDRGGVSPPPPHFWGFRLYRCILILCLK